MNMILPSTTNFQVSHAQRRALIASLLTLGRLDKPDLLAHIQGHLNLSVDRVLTREPDSGEYLFNQTERFRFDSTTCFKHELMADALTFDYFGVLKGTGVHTTMDTSCYAGLSPALDARPSGFLLTWGITYISTMYYLGCLYTVNKSAYRRVTEEIANMPDYGKTNAQKRTLEAAGRIHAALVSIENSMRAINTGLWPIEYSTLHTERFLQCSNATNEDIVNIVATPSLSGYANSWDCTYLQNLIDCCRRILSGWHVVLPPFTIEQLRAPLTRDEFLNVTTTLREWHNEPFAFTK